MSISGAVPVSVWEPVRVSFAHAGQPAVLPRPANARPRPALSLKDFIDERWKGMYPVAWGETLRESAYTQWVYSEVMGLGEEI